MESIIQNRTKSSRCIHVDCLQKDPKKRPKAVYGFSGQGQILCAKHKEFGMIRIGMTCQTENCQITATYGHEISSKIIPTKCSKHKEQNMQTKDKRTCKYCAEQGKKTRPVYGNMQDNIPIVCLKHNKEHFAGQLIDLVSIRCKLCDKQPVFGAPGSKKKEYCVDHKPEGMVNVMAAKCLTQGCDKQPKYGLQKAEVCAEHKLQGMKNFGKTCIVCRKIEPVFGIQGNVPTHCAKCKTTVMVDVKNIRCDAIDCGIIGQYGFLGLRSFRCKQHADEYMQNYPQSKCEFCQQYAQYGVNTKPKHCYQHKQYDDMWLSMRKCIQCQRIDILNDQLVCNICAEEKFRQARLHKQLQVKEFIQQKFHILQYDSSIEDNLRPDFVIESFISNHKIILEVDEEQHKRYKTNEYDINRMQKISKIIGNVIFIRFNPDSYIDHNGVRKNQPISERFDTLEQYINAAQILEVNGNYVVQKIFFDGFKHIN